MAAASATASQFNYRSIAGMFGDWIRQGTEGFVATEKILLDLAAQQNALALTILRERVGLPSFSAKKLADFAGQGIRNLMEAQRQVLNMVARQNGILAEGLKPILPGAPVRSLANVIHGGLDDLITAQTRLLDIVQLQAEGATVDFGEGRSFNAGRLADLAREAALNYLESQKRFLDIVEKEIVKKDPAEAEASGESMDFFEMAKKSTDSYIETLQKLLDLASSQVQANVKFAQEIFADGAPMTSMTDVVKKSADSFVAAQKALLELASKPRKPQGPDETKQAATA
jgi:hypothetical protein